MNPRILPLLALALLAACTPSLEGAVCEENAHCLETERCVSGMCTRGAPDGGPAPVVPGDGGSGTDGGASPGDAGPGEDAGTDVDAGTGPDAGAPGDAGSDGDAGLPLDAGVQDDGGSSGGGGTGEDAGVPDAGTLAPDGAACFSPSECQSAHCTDGVCCATACLGTCESCRLPGGEGTCMPLAARTDPLGECGGDYCSGTGACGPCSPSLGCKIGYYCEATGCAPLKADGQPCVQAAECLGGACTMGTCGAPAQGKANGSPCQQAGECRSAQCVDGVCCDSGCTGTCVSCAVPGSVGSCTHVPTGSDPDSECGLTSCAAGSCLQGCTSNGECKAGAECRAGNCVDVGSLKALGTGCTSGDECRSGACVDGVCCGSPCAGTCEACNLTNAEGVCSPISNGGDPGSECGYGYCNGNSQCATGCAADANCKPGAICRTGSCISASSFKSNGQPCSLGAECLSNHCVDGVCCDTACNGGACDACSAALGATANGHCTFLAATTVCRASQGVCDAAESCTGQSGECPPDAYRAQGSSCGDPVINRTQCSAPQACDLQGSQTETTTTYACNGAGSCVASVSSGVSVSCARSTNGNSCGTTVMEYGTCTVMDCSNPPCGCESDVYQTTYQCSGGTCLALRAHQGSQSCFSCSP